jgi:amino acid adenylation domain-containing protein
MLEDAGAAVLVTRSELVALAGGYAGAVVYVDRDAGQLGEESAAELEAEMGQAVMSEQLAYVIYTSGSTGRPKGVGCLHSAVVNMVADAHSRQPLSTNDSCSLWTSLSFDVSVYELFTALLSGATLHIVPEETRSDARSFVRWLSERRITGAYVPGFALPELAQQAAQGSVGLSLRRLLVGVEPIEEELLREIADGIAGVRVMNGYGPTEATVYATCYEAAAGGIAEAEQQGAGQQRTPIGRAIANTRVYVLDESGAPAPQGVAGELYIGGAGLARGYQGRAELTAERFVPDPFGREAGGRLYRTGDVVRWRGDGQLEFMGRADHQVKVRGYRIELGEIEAVLSNCAGVREAVVLAHEDSAGDKRLVAYVVGEQPAPGNDELRHALREQLPEYMIPTAFVRLDELPRTPNGKVNHKALPVWDQSAQEAAASYVAPRTEIEELLSQLWANVLGVGRVSVEDNFFALGGHSLLATQLVARVRGSLGVELPLRAVFEEPTLGGLALRVERLLRGVTDEVEGALVAEADERERMSGPLSYAQQRLWFLQQLEPDNPFYNLGLAIRLRGSINATALENSFNEIVRRHDVLRSAFVNIEGQPLARIAPAFVCPLPVSDLSALPEAERQIELSRLLNEESQRPFDLQRGPLLRLNLIKLAATEHVLVISMHHIISDGWSIKVLFNELNTLYSVETGEAIVGLPPLPIQYGDYARWERRRSASASAPALDYWLSQLSGAPALLSLPTDRPRPPVQRYRGAALSFSLGQRLSSRLATLAQAETATLFMTLVAGFSALLSRYSGQPEVVVGTPVAGRSRSEVEALIGLFVNTLALRVEVGGDPTGRELLRRVRAVCLGAYAHQEVPFERVVEALGVERSLSQSPVFQVLLGFDNTGRGELRLGAAEAELVGVEGGAAKYDLTMGLEMRGGRIVGRLSYDRELYSEETARRMVRHYRRALAWLSSLGGGERLSRLSLLTAGERRQLLYEWNATHVERANEQRLPLLFEAQAAQTPDALAVVCEGAQLTYGELNRRANQLAHYLRRLGVGPRNLIGLCVERGTQMVVGLLGILKAGCAYVPLDATYPRERLAFMLSDAQVSVLLTSERLAGHVNPTTGRAVCLDSEWAEIARESESNLPITITADDLAYIIYTSGSTGRPKGVGCLHSAVVNMVADAQSRQPLSTNDSCSLWTSLSFDVSVYELFTALLSGATLHIVPEETRSDALSFVRWLSERRITGAYVPGFALPELARQAAQGSVGLSLRRLLVGVEPIEEELLREIADGIAGVRVMNGYGPTEATVYATCYEVGGVEARPAEAGHEQAPIGRAIANTRVYVLDEHLAPVPQGVTGELCIGGAGLARGYQGRAELTAERFVPDPFGREAGGRLYRTGDLVRWRGDGQLEFMGRLDGQVKVRGYRIELGEIEAVLKSYPEVVECIALASADAAGEQRLTAYVVSSPSAEPPTAGALREHLKQSLAEPMIPAAFVMLDAFPLTPNGKIDRAALAALGAAALVPEHDYVAPRTPTEATLADIWRDVVNVERIGVDDNFFEIGGHSLMVTQVMWRARETFQVELSLRTLFERPTIAELAEAVELAQAAHTTIEAQVITRIDRERYRASAPRQADELTEFADKN